ncbi:Vegetative incompatibility protein HET-E-1 [Ilyonectria robusta]
MSWAVDGIASREEDTTYSLGAIAGVTIPVRYGEGTERAFSHLQEEILHDTRDGSIFARRSVHNQKDHGLLARSPSEFRHFTFASGSVWEAPWIFDDKVQFSSKGIQVPSWISKHGSCILLEIGRRVRDSGSNDKFGFFLREWNGIYVRVNPSLDTVKIDHLQFKLDCNVKAHGIHCPANLRRVEDTREYWTSFFADLRAVCSWRRRGV